MSNFQIQVNTQPAPAIAGDFASANPRFSMLAGPGGLVAGSAGVTIGRFAWATAAPADADGAPSVVNNFGAGPISGFVHREQQGLITVYLQEQSVVIPGGFEMALMTGGDFWVKNEGTTQALPGMFAYAALGNGAASFAASGTAVANSSVTGSIAAVSATFNGYASGNVLTVTGTTNGVAIAPGGFVSGTASNGSLSAGQTIVSQLSGTPGGIGTYALSIPEQTVATSGSVTNFTETYGLLTVSAVASGTVTIGGTLTGTGVAASTTVTGLGTGTGNTGTYYVNNTQTQSSTAYTIGSQVATKFIAMSSALPGELCKISSHPLG